MEYEEWEYFQCYIEFSDGTVFSLKTQFFLNDAPILFRTMQFPPYVGDEFYHGATCSNSLDWDAESV